MSDDPFLGDPIQELRFALAGADALVPSANLRDGAVVAALSGRTPGWPVSRAGSVSGLEAFRRVVSRFDRLLDALTGDEWARPALRDLNVQGLVGHLIGVEEAFARTLRGETSAAEADHVESTQERALSQQGRAPAETQADWISAVEQTIQLAGDAQRDDEQIRFQGITLTRDALLIMRAFELWTHDEDVRRATDRPLADPDPETLTRMTDLATMLLPAGINRIQPAEDGTTRLVLTGTGGGAWDVPLHGGAVARAQPGVDSDALVVIDAAEFCRVVANRSDLARSGAVVNGDADVAQTLLAGAAALALD